MANLIWLALAVALFVAVLAAHRGIDRLSHGRTRHTDDVAGQVFDFEQARRALAKRRHPASRWYSTTNGTDPS